MMHAAWRFLGTPRDRPRFVGDNSCTTPPAGFSSEELTAWSAKCTQEGAVAWMQENTGISPVVDSDGNVDWKATAEATIYIESGGVSVDIGVVDENGSVKWDIVARDAGSIGGAAVCIAFGAGAATPTCSYVGGKLGDALYILGEGFVGLFAKRELPPPTPLPTGSDDLHFAIRSLAVNEVDMLQRMAVMRATSFLVRKIVVQMVRHWFAVTGDVLPPAMMLQKLKGAGLLVPPGWATWFSDHLLVSPVEHSVVYVWQNGACVATDGLDTFSLAHTTIATVLDSILGVNMCWGPVTSGSGNVDLFSEPPPGKVPVAWKTEAGIGGGTLIGQATLLDPWQGITGAALGARDCFESPATWDGIDVADKHQGAAIDAWVLATAHYGGSNVAGPLVLVRKPLDVTMWSAPHDETLMLHTGSTVYVGQSAATCRAPEIEGQPPPIEVIAVAPDVQIDFASSWGDASWRESAYIVQGLCRVDMNLDMFEIARGDAAAFEALRGAWLQSIPDAVTRVRAEAIRTKTVDSPVSPTPGGAAIDPALFCEQGTHWNDPAQMCVNDVQQNAYPGDDCVTADGSGYLDSSMACVITTPTAPSATKGFPWGTLFGAVAVAGVAWFGWRTYKHQPIVPAWGQRAGAWVKSKTWGRRSR